MSIVRKNDLYLPSSIRNSAAKNGMNAALETCPQSAKHRQDPSLDPAAVSQLALVADDLGS